MTSKELENHIDRILEHYDDYKECDPNIVEFIFLSEKIAHIFIARCRNYEIRDRNAKDVVPDEYALLQKYRKLCPLVKQKLLENDLGFTTEHPLYKIFNDSIYGVETLCSYADTELRAYLSGVTLYIAQQKRAVRKGEISSFTYSNMNELMEIHRLNNIQRPVVTIGNDGKRVDYRRDLLNKIEEDFGAEFTSENLNQKNEIVM